MAGPRSLPLSLVPCNSFGWVCLVQGPFEGGLGMPGLRALLEGYSRERGGYGYIQGEEHGYIQGVGMFRGVMWR